MESSQRPLSMTETDELEVLRMRVEACQRLRRLLSQILSDDFVEKVEAGVLNLIAMRQRDDTSQ